jgi:hypothetical protein
VIGQGSATGGIENNGAGPTSLNATGFLGPVGFVANGSLYVSDTFNGRVLGWNSVPTTNGVPADFVIGAPDFVTVGGGTSATRLRLPTSCWAANNALFVVDDANERVLVWNSLPTGDVPADIALGKPNLTTEGETAGQAGLSTTIAVAVALNRIVVTDEGNHRVMVWNGIPTVSGANADLVLGQADFTTTTSGTSATTMEQPAGVWTDGVRLAVADLGNNRVLIWNTFPTANGQPADLVVGQPDFVTDAPGTGPSKMDRPFAVASDGFQLFVADTDNNRVLIFSPFPTTSNPAATGVLGQGNFANVAANDDDQDGIADTTPTARTLRGPAGVTAVGRQLFVCDTSNHRVLIFDSP